MPGTPSARPTPIADTSVGALPEKRSRERSRERRRRRGTPTAPLPEIVPRKRTQRVPQETPQGFDPLGWCPQPLRRRFERRAAQAARQPMRAIELKCLECCCWDRPEVMRCENRRCPLWVLSRRIFGSTAEGETR